MTRLAALFVQAGTVLLAAIAATIAMQLLTGAINVSGLLRVKTGRRRSTEISPGRIQLLIGTLATAAAYLAAIPDSIGTGRLPEVDTRLLYGLGASQGLYLIGKLQQLGSLRDVLRRLTVTEEP